METYPTVHQVVLDTRDARGLAEFYRQMFGLSYREGDEIAIAAIERSGRAIGQDDSTLLHSCSFA